jgi:hypothetical protein
MQKLFLVLFLFLSYNTIAQIPGGGGRPSGAGQNMNIGRFYGKITDTKTNKGIEASSVQLVQSVFDTATKAKKIKIISGQLTKSNGDFSLEGLSVRGQYTLRVTAIGYLTLEKQVKFDLGANGNDFSKIMSNADVDLGNIKLEVDAKKRE